MHWALYSIEHDRHGPQNQAVTLAYVSSTHTVKAFVEIE